MIKFNDNNIYVGQIKQIIKDFNLPNCQVYREEFDSFYVNSESTEENNLDIVYIKNNNLYRGNKVISSYKFNDKIQNITSNYYITSNIYDTTTHKYLGEYLRFIRDYTGLDLMQMYNCFTNETPANLHLDNFDINDESSQIFILPIKFNRTYTIGLDCSSRVELRTCNYESKDIVDTDVRHVSKIFSGTKFNKPFIFESPKVEKSSDLINEKTLKLLIKIPVTCKSSIVVLEGDYRRGCDLFIDKKKDKNGVLYDDSQVLASVASGELLRYNHPSADRIFEERTLINKWGTQQFIGNDIPQSANFFYPENGESEEGSYNSNSFAFQVSGGGSTVDSIAYNKELRGKTYRFNQLIGDGNFTSSNKWYTPDVATKTIANNIGTLTAISTSSEWGIFRLQVTSAQGQFEPVIGHKYLFKVSAKINSGNYKRLSLYIQQVGAGGASVYTSFDADDRWNEYGFVFECGNYPEHPIRALTYADSSQVSIGDSFSARNMQLFDLTEMFGSGNEPSTLLEFDCLFLNTYYSHTLGTLLSSKSHTYKVVGYNAFDGIFEQGSYRQDTGFPSGTPSVTAIRSKNFIEVIPGQQYTLESLNRPFTNGLYIYLYADKSTFIRREWLTSSNTENYTTKSGKYTIPAGAHYIRFSLQNNSGTVESISPIDATACFHLTKDESKVGYETHWSKTYSLPGVELRSAGTVYDTITPDGTLTRRVDIVNLGTLITTQTANSNGVIQISATSIDIVQNTDYLNITNLLCSKYETASYNDVYSAIVKKSIATINKVIGIQDDDFIGKTAQEIKTILDGVYLVYELAEPVTSQVIYLDEDVNYYISKPQLLYLNTQSCYLLADRLLEYLSRNTIDSNEEIDENIKLVQRAINTSNFTVNYLDGVRYIPEYYGIWDDKIKESLYNFVYKYKNTYNRKQVLNNHFDMLGYFDKDVEYNLQYLLNEDEKTFEV